MARKMKKIEERRPQEIPSKVSGGILRHLISFVFYIVTSPFRLMALPFGNLYTKWFGPPPLVFGALPVNHDEPDFAKYEEKGMFKGQVVFVLITSFFIIAFFWASTAELDEQVRAEGAIIPPSDIQIVQSRLPGSITDIHVSLGTEVQKGDVIFRVEDSDVLADFAENEVIIASRQAAIWRLQAEIDGATELSFPQTLHKAAPESVAKETNLFHQRNIAFQEQESVLRQSIAEIEGNIAEKMAEAEISDQQYLIRKSEYDLIKPLVDAGHESKLSLIEAETRWRQAKGAAELARLSVKAMSARQIGLQREISLLSSQRRAEASQLLVESQTSLKQAKARKKSLQERVAYADIRAPETGTISALHIKTIGAVVQAGSQLAEIVPANSEHVVRARLLPQDVADVTLGQLARVSLSAYDVSRYGSLEGEVIHVASNTTEEPDIPPYYETMIALTQKSFPNIDLTPEIVPGMQVTVDIIGGKRTVLEYILSPIEKATSVAFREK